MSCKGVFIERINPLDYQHVTVTLQKINHANPIGLGRLGDRFAKHAVLPPAGIVRGNYLQSCTIGAVKPVKQNQKG